MHLIFTTPHIINSPKLADDGIDTKCRVSPVIGLVWYMHRCYPWIKLWLIFSTLFTLQTPLTCTNWSFAISSDSNGYEVSHDFKMSLNIFWLIRWLCKKRPTTQIAKLMGPTWVLPAPDGPDDGLTNLDIREEFSKFCDTFYIKPEV